MDSLTDIIRKCIQNDSRAQRELYDRYKARLMGICRRYTSNRDEAHDILQESFIKIFSKISQLSAPEKLEGWMLRIAVTTAVDYYHKNKRFVFDTLDNVHNESEDHERIFSSITDKYLIEMINTLPDGCRVIFNLFIVEGYSHAEIAQMLEVTESTSRSQLVYAKTLLKEKLNAVGVLRYERYA